VAKLESSNSGAIKNLENFAPGAVMRWKSKKPDGTDSEYISRVNADGTVTYIPNDPNNGDWQEYQVWLAVPNTPLPAEG
jgi:hypothetical protein